VAALGAALATGVLVLPVSAPLAWITDRACNHLEGDVEVAQPGTPRGAWCSVVEPGHSRLMLMLVPALLAVMFVILLSRWRSAGLCFAIWVVVCALLGAVASHIEMIRAYPEI